MKQEMMGRQWHLLDHMQIICTLLQTDNYHSTSSLSFTGQMPFLPPNQQHQSTEGKMSGICTTTPHHNHFTAFSRDHPVPEENFWTLWCKGRLTEADTPTILLGATPSGLTSAHLHHPPIFFTGRMPFLPPNQVSKH